MTAPDALPLPAELATPEPDPTGWLERMLDEAFAVADEAGVDDEGVLLAELDADDEPDQPERWRITGTGSAEWAMRLVAEADTRLRAIHDQAEEWHNRIDEWATREARRPLATRMFMGAHLERYALERRAEDPKHNKTLTLPSGSVPTREAPAKLVVTDEEGALDWAQTFAPDAVIRRLGLAELKAAVKPRERATVARVVRSCGCIVDLKAEPGEWLTLPGLGDGVTCDACEQDALVGRIEIDETAWFALTEGTHQAVGWATVEPPEVRATGVKPVTS